MSIHIHTLANGIGALADKKKNSVRTRASSKMQMDSFNMKGIYTYDLRNTRK